MVAKDVNTVIKVGKMFGNALAILCIPFVLSTIWFGLKRNGGYYDTDQYDGDGTAHKVLK